MGKRKTPLELGRRERQIVETVVKLVRQRSER